MSPERNKHCTHPPQRLRARAELLTRVRSFLAERGVLEVETQVLGSYPASDPQVESPQLLLRMPGGCRRRHYLHASPEHAMKRLLAEGSGPIYQVCKVFRDGECGPRHAPEFTMLEWYRPGYDAPRLMEEVADLLVLLGFARPARLGYRGAFQKFAGVDPLLDSEQLLRGAAECVGRWDPDGADRDQLLDFLLAFQVGPRLGLESPLFLHGYPASQALQARLCPQDPRLAERFELFIDGMEIASGAAELTQAAELRRRLRERSPRRWDRELVAAVETGLPECAGVAMGLDRLLMLRLGARCIEEVLSLPGPATRSLQ